MMPVEKLSKKKNKKHRKKAKITFDEEIMPKTKAEQFKLQKLNEEHVEKTPHRNKIKKNKKINSEHDLTKNIGKNQTSLLLEPNIGEQKEKMSKKKKVKREEDDSKNQPFAKKSKNSEELEEENVDGEDVIETQNELDPKNLEIKTSESIRAIKRKKHSQLLMEKKLKSELKMQGKCLNYLSQWKHNREGWKFEKLKQIWLQQNMFDDAKVPDKFWEDVIEYFNNSKGKSRQDILKGAVKVIEDIENVEGDMDENTTVKYNRARTIVQNLQE